MVEKGENMMKALLIHTDGYTIDVVGQYDSVEEASRNLYLEYEKTVFSRDLSRMAATITL